jgi:hypothetical protein
MRPVRAVSGNRGGTARGTGVVDAGTVGILFGRRRAQLGPATTDQTWVLRTETRPDTWEK